MLKKAVMAKKTHHYNGTLNLRWKNEKTCISTAGTLQRDTLKVQKYIFIIALTLADTKSNTK